MFARLKRTNVTAMKHSNHHAVHSAVHIEPRTTSWGGKEQNFPLTNAAGLCRAVGELPAKVTIRRRKEMERESNYPSAKTDANLDTGPSPGQTDVGSDVCTDCFHGGAGKRAPGGTGSCGSPLGQQMVQHTSQQARGGCPAAFPRNIGLCLALRDGASQPGTAVLCGDGGGAQAELCW